MNKLVILIVLILGSLAVIPFEGTSGSDEFYSSDTIKHLQPEKKYVNETKIINELLDRYHYRKLRLNDSLSSVILDNYIISLDYNKSFFLKKDIDSFEKYRFELDEAIRAGNLTIAFDIFNVFQDRFFERMVYVDSSLVKGFDFTIDEKIETSRDAMSWKQSEVELDDLWRKSLKNQILSLTLSGKEYDKSVEVLVKRYTTYRTIIRQYKPSDVYQYFMNAYTESFDPHTNYLNPMSSENFDIDMNKSLEGIGATLTKDGDYTIVVRIIPGGPASRSNELHKDDRIAGVGQGEDGEIVDVVGWRNDDVVKLIRGKKGTVLRLSVLKAEDGANATLKIVRLERDKINLEDMRASSKVYKIGRNGKSYSMGVITIPDFYNTVTADVEKLIVELNKAGIDGMLIDLRRNGGGALNEAINLTGLFINDGPVVQVRDRTNKIEIGRDDNKRIAYEGPLTVLINRSSASASEIFSGAIQDYDRGVILGEQTFGKGSVQSLIDLNRVARTKGEENKMGNVKITLSKYYRITGSSTQNIGVTPDVALPSAYNHKEFGESSMPAALPWDRISATSFNKTDLVNDELLDLLNSEYLADLNSDPELKKLVSDIEKRKERRKQTSLSLNKDVRLQLIEIEKQKEDAAKELNPKILNENESFSIEGTDGDGLSVLDDTYLKESLRLLAKMVDYRIG